MSVYYRSHNKSCCKKIKIGKLLSEANAIPNITISGVCNFERAFLKSAICLTGINAENIHRFFAVSIYFPTFNCSSLEYNVFSGLLQVSVREGLIIIFLIVFFFSFSFQPNFFFLTLTCFKRDVVSASPTINHKTNKITEKHVVII